MPGDSIMTWDWSLLLPATDLFVCLFVCFFLKPSEEEEINYRSINHQRWMWEEVRGGRREAGQWNAFNIPCYVYECWYWGLGAIDNWPHVKWYWDGDFVLISSDRYNEAPSIACLLPSARLIARLWDWFTNGIFDIELGFFFWVHSRWLGLLAPFFSIDEFSCFGC